MFNRYETSLRCLKTKPTTYIMHSIVTENSFTVSVKISCLQWAHKRISTTQSGAHYLVEAVDINDVILKLCRLS